jgi:hypothetical protein
VNLDLDLALKTLGLAIPLGGIIYTWFATRQKDVDEAFKAISERLDTGSKRMDALELRAQATELALTNMPDKDDMHSLQLMLSEMGGEMKAMRATMRSVAESQGRFETVLTRHEDYLRDHT